MHWLLGLVLLTVGVMPALAQDANGRSPALCGCNDTPETGIQGDVPLADQESGRAEQGYNCGLAIVAHNDVGGEESGDMAWSGHCAYQQDDDGIRVLDVSDPTNPVILASVPQDSSGAENLHAVTTAERAVLINGSAIYDIGDCENPVYKGDIPWPPILKAHNATLGPDGTKAYASFGVQIADISDLDDSSSWTAVDYGCDILAEYHPLYEYLVELGECETLPERETSMSHEPALNADGTRLYLAGQQPQPYKEVMVILDITTEPPAVITSLDNTPGHGLRRATIGGVDFLLHSDETAPGVPQPAERRANGCLPEDGTPYAGAAQPYLTDISDETNPVTVSQLPLAINKQEPRFCAAAIESSVNSTSHYHEVDDPDDATFAMLSMKNGGLRIFDIRNPATPVEVAYFNAGQLRLADDSTVLDRTRLHTHYHAETGHIWLTTESHGFYVLELEPQVRAALGLADPTGGYLYPNGRPALASAPTATTCNGLPDIDLDGVPDVDDNCRFVANFNQQDRGGINSTDPDGIGDACQCGDVTGNGIVNGQDGGAITRHGLDIEPNPSFNEPGNCDVSGNGRCNGQDTNAVRRAALGFGPATNRLFGQRCHNATGEAIPVDL